MGSSCLDLTVVNGYSLVPGLVEGEGQYCASMVRTSDVEYQPVASMKRGGNMSSRKVVQTPVPESLGKLFDVKVKLRLKGETVTAVPENISAEVSAVEAVLHVIAAGTAVGVLKGKDLVPDADLALSIIFREDSYPYADVDRQTALEFLHKDPILLTDKDKGYHVIRYEGLPLGFVKNLGNRCNNLHPQARRIRMDIK